MYRVLPNGRVDAASIVVRSSRHRTDLREYVEQARAIAVNCVYKPAVVDGQAVEAMVRRTFHFAG